MLPSAKVYRRMLRQINSYRIISIINILHTLTHVSLRYRSLVLFLKRPVYGWYMASICVQQKYVTTTTNAT